MPRKSKFSFENSHKETYELTSKDLQVLWTYKNLITQLVCPTAKKDTWALLKTTTAESQGNPWIPGSNTRIGKQN